ncbi:hypothetical protein B296_00027262 [Ensete ventricosum]|uniref:Spo11/DNA topoisomerase VI subunit A N-terminal domain-containing protein n=1 Tax=Ensete ventricosum TaxID=4639 RepID=A0A427ANG2_ENSVE|nr:hypothetical protein B296_00027262 [Ensete ventricosum]
MTKWILVMPKWGSGSIFRVGGWKIRIRVDSSEWVFASPGQYIKWGVCSDTTTVCVEMEPNLLESSLFYADQRLCSAEILPPSQVRARIEVAVLNFLKNLTASNPTISNLPLVCLSVRNLKPGHVPRSLCSHLACSCYFYVCWVAIVVWMVMAMCFRILVQGKLATQRELFYKLLCDAPEYFRSQRQVNRAVQVCYISIADVVALLRCTRHSLGIMASSRGAVIGRMVLEEPGEQIVDCSMIGNAGYAITGDLCTLSKLVLHSDARYIIIIEKVDSAPTAAPLPCRSPPVGAPHDVVASSLAAAALAAAVASNRAPCRCTSLLPPLHLLVVASYPATVVSHYNTQPSSAAVLSLNEVNSVLHLQERYQAELSLMVERGYRAEIEALYCHGFDFLGKYIAKKIVQADYI